MKRFRVNMAWVYLCLYQCLQFFNLCLPYSMYISSEFNFVLFVLILFERIYSERKFNVGVTASMCHVV